MGNCLIKRINTAISNSNLPKYGEISFEFNVYGSASLAISVNKSTQIKLSDATFADGGTIKTSSFNETVNSSKDSFKVSVDDGKSITGFVIGTINTCYGQSIDVGVFKSCTSLTKIMDTSWKSVLYGNVELLKDLKLTEFAAYNCTGLTGNIATAFGKMTTLTKLATHACYLSGTVESLVAALRNAGKTSGSIAGQGDSYQFGGYGVTFNGSQAMGSLSWTANTITCGGVTINN